MAVNLKNYGKYSRALITHDGQERTLLDWCRLLNLDYSTVRMRFVRGKTGDDLFHATTTGFYERTSSGAQRDPNTLSKKQQELAKTPPAIFYNLSPETREKLIRYTGGEREAITRTIVVAVERYLED